MQWLLWLLGAIAAPFVLLHLWVLLGVMYVKPRASLALARILASLPLRHTRRHSSILRALAFADQGLSTRAESEVDALLALEREPSAKALNVAVDVRVTLGQYRKALAVPRLSRKSNRRRRRCSFLWIDSVTYVDRAEALYNLGRSREALRILDVVQRGARWNPTAIAAIRLLRTWVYAQRGEGTKARREASGLSGFAVETLKPRYLPEIEFAHASALRAAGNLEDALRRAQSGLNQARRISSQRNGLVLVAALLAESGSSFEARALLEKAASFAYKGQSAAGLLLLGDLLERLGENDRALACYRDAIRWDAESYLARLAARAIERISGVDRA